MVLWATRIIVTVVVTRLSFLELLASFRTGRGVGNTVSLMSHDSSGAMDRRSSAGSLLVLAVPTGHGPADALTCVGTYRLW